MYKYIISISFFAICASSLFLSSAAFVNTEIAPKWYVAVTGSFGLVILAIMLSFANKQQAYKQLITSTFPIIAALCTLQAVYRILQYYGIFTGNNGFRITGSFDNPAGFAACLCAGFPCVFYYFFNRNTWLNRIAYLEMVIIVWAVFFSGSRAGIIAIILTAILKTFYEFRSQTKIARKNILLTISIAFLISGLYFLKKDSADGRLLIWRCSWEMIKEKPLFGYGANGFKANYMDFQAKYFEEHPGSQFAMLADNVNSPFNEYILLVANYGLTGLLLFCLFAIFIRKSFLLIKNKIPADYISVWCLLSIATFAAFSYPLKYPFVWIMGLLSIGFIILRANYKLNLSKMAIHFSKITVILILIIGSVFVWKHIKAERLWCNIAHKSLIGQTEAMLPIYKQLHHALATNELFLYNYAAELNVAGYYDESKQIAQECERLWTDYDLQMLMADNYEQTKQYIDAEKHYRKAALMCPVKFMPLYKLANIYLEEGKETEALSLANTILEKKIKVPSRTVSDIRNEMQQLINSKEKQQIKRERQDKVSSEASLETILPP
jgi:O-antigen ligase